MSAELERFARGEVDPRNFPHREHVRMAFEMLRRHDFAETVLHYSRALRAIRGIGWVVSYIEPKQGRLINEWINEHEKRM